MTGPVKTVLAPNLSVANGADALGFYKDAFGAKELYTLESEIESGQIMVAQMAIGEAEFWFAESGGHAEIVAADMGETPLIRLLLTVADPDAVFAQAIKAGAYEVVAIHEEYGWRSGVVVDPDGHWWEIARSLES